MFVSFKILKGKFYNMSEFGSKYYKVSNVDSENHNVSDFESKSYALSDLESNFYKVSISNQKIYNGSDYKSIDLQIVRNCLQSLTSLFIFRINYLQRYVLKLH